jgi:integrase
LERDERPSLTRKEKRVLNTAEIVRLLDAATAIYRPMLATAIYTGLRMNELLALTWADIDFDRGFVRVNGQLERRTRQRVETKTERGVREVVLIPALARVLRAHREHAFARGFARATDLVFSTPNGTGLSDRNVAQRGLEKAAERAGLNEPGKPKLTMHRCATHTCRT